MNLTIRIYRSTIFLAMLFTAGNFIEPLKLAGQTNSFENDNKNFYFPPLGRYRPVTPLPKDFSDFCELVISFSSGEDALSAKPDANGKINMHSLVRTGTINIEKINRKLSPSEAFEAVKCRNGEEFNAISTALLSENTHYEKFFKRPLKFFDKLYFETAPIKGVSFKFEGSFLGKSRLENGNYINLQGDLIKFNDGMEIARTRVKFYRWVFL